MTQTGAQLLTGLSSFVDDLETSTTTSAGASDGSTLIDTYLQKYQDNRLQGRFVRITASGANQYQVVSIASNVQATGTVHFNGVLPAQVGSGVTYELHRYEPLKKFRALDQAVLDASDHSFILVYNELYTADGNTNVFPIPTEMGLGPILVYEESPVPCQNIIWNFLSSPVGNSTDPWTTINCTATIVNIDYTDLIVPKYDWASTKIFIDASTAATYYQPVAEMANNFTAAKAAGRLLTFGMWIYCTEPDKVRIGIADDSNTSGAAFSDYHSGLGWELLYLEHTPAGDNDTVLTAFIDIASTPNPATIFWNRTWLYFGQHERITEAYDDEAFPTVRRDDTTQTYKLTRVPARGHQLRTIGQQTLTQLGTNTTTQVTNSMEVNAKTASMLYAFASQILLEWESLTAKDVPEIYTRINTVKSRAARVDKFRQHIPSKHASSPYMQ